MLIGHSPRRRLTSSVDVCRCGSTIALDTINVHIQTQVITEADNTADMNTNVACAAGDNEQINLPLSEQDCHID